MLQELQRRLDSVQSDMDWMRWALSKLCPAGLGQNISEEWKVELNPAFPRR